MKKSIFLLFITVSIFYSCSYIGGEKIHGNGNIKTENRQENGFEGISVSGAINTYVTQDSIVSVKIEADENLMEYIYTGVRGGILEIKPEKGFNLRPSGKIKVFVSAPFYSTFRISGACDLVGQNKITSNNAITIKLSGAGKTEMEIQSPRIDVDLSGAGLLRLKGQTKEFKVDGSGSSDIKCFELLTESTQIGISGAGDAEVFASVSLDVRVSGAGSVKYRGNPSIKQKVSGAGSIRKIE